MENKKLRILAASDLQGRKILAENLAKKALTERVDVVVLAGDINEMGEGDEGMLEPFTKAKQKVVFIPGNWDTSIEHTAMKKEGTSIDGTYVRYNNVGIIGIGDRDMKMSLNNKDFEQLQYTFKKITTKKNILVSHLHAAGTKAEFSGFTGDKIVRQAIETFQPDILIAGHIHEAEGLEDTIGKTKIIQVGRNGTIIEI